MRIVVLPSARRDLRQLPREIGPRVAQAVDALAREPRPAGCQLLPGYHPPTWRLRVGDGRLLYHINDDTSMVTITGVRHRSRAYRPP